MKRKIFILFALMLASQTSNAAEPGALRPSPAMLAYACGACHGTFGHSQGATPSIHGRPEAEFIRLMQEFKSGQRQASVMNRIARGYTNEDFKALARFHRSQ